MGAYFFRGIYIRLNETHCLCTDCKLFKAVADAPSVLVIFRTFSVCVENLFGFINIAINFPYTAVFEIKRTSVHKTIHIFGRITKEKAYFVRKIRCAVQLADKLHNAVIAVFKGIAALSEQVGSHVVCKVIFQLKWSVEINQNLALVKSQW